MPESLPSQQWHAESPQLPSFYSPPAGAPHGAHDDANIDESDIPPLNHAAPRSSLSDFDETASNASSIRSSQTLAPPPPSFLSPAFTPPSTPGDSTPPKSSALPAPLANLSHLTNALPHAVSSSVSSLASISTSASASASTSEPRGVPVDSSVPTGGCGTKRPRLLATLPRVRCLVRARIPTTTGAEMWLHLYENDVDNKEHMAIVFGPAGIRSTSLDEPRAGETEWDRLVRGAYTGRLYPGRTTSGFATGGAATWAGAKKDEKAETEAEAGTAGTPRSAPPLVRIHSECYTGETVWSARCDCGEQLDEAARLMSLPGNRAGGIIIYLRQEGRGIGLGEKLKAYNLQDLGNDTVEANLLLRHPADARSYGLATAMLRDLGQREIRLLTNNPDKIRAVEGPNREIVVTERVAMVPLSWEGRGGFRAKEVDGYLKTKIEKMGHMLSADAMPEQ